MDISRRYIFFEVKVKKCPVSPSVIRTHVAYLLGTYEEDISNKEVDKCPYIVRIWYLINIISLFLY